MSNIEIEKSEARIEAEKAAVLSMRNAKSNMDAALSRIETLEGQLRTAVLIGMDISRMVGPEAKISSKYGGQNYPNHRQNQDSQVTCSELCRALDFCRLVADGSNSK